MKKLVIIGGGFAGTKVAKELENKFETTLIDMEDFFEYTPGILRVLVEPGHYNKIRANHKDYLKKARIVIGEVVDLSDKNVLLKSGEKISFDYLVISSGSSYNTPIKEDGVFFASRVKHLQESYNDIFKAKKICVVGGGLVGTELMAEICTHYKDKDLYIIHPHSRLLERNNKKTSEYARKFLEKNNVKIIFNERVKLLKNKKLITESGKTFEADVSFFTVGIKPNFQFMRKHFSKEIKNGIMVNKFLQLEGREKIFVCGDVAGIKEEKTAQNAENHAKLVIHNIKSIENKLNLRPYESKKRLIVISLGKFKGIIEKGKFFHAGFIPAFMKTIIEKYVMSHYRD